MTIKLKKNGLLTKKINVDKDEIKPSISEWLDAIYERSLKSDDDAMRYFFDAFLSTFNNLDPKKAKIIESMRPIIFNSNKNIEEAFYKLFRTFSISGEIEKTLDPKKTIIVDGIIGIFWGIFERIRNGGLDPKKVEELMMQILKSNKDKELTEDDLYPKTKR